MTKPRLTGIPGGFGAGKSFVSRILAAMGYEVYDSDSRAKSLMNRSADIRRQLVESFGGGVVDSQGNIDRKSLASIVFTDAEALKRLNSIVHGAVLRDIEEWLSQSDGDRLFVETAILYQSGMNKMVDDVWEVTAPEPVRIARIVARNGITAEEAMARIDSQRITIDHPHPLTYVIDNSADRPLLPQIHELLTLV